MQAGRLRHRVWIQKATRTRDAVGQAVPTWANAPGGHVYMDIQPLRGEERLAAQQLSPRMSHKGKLRYWAGLTPDEHRINWGDRIFDINSVVNVGERNIRMELLCSEAL